MDEQGRSVSPVPRVTVVVPARDAEGTLGETLDSLAAQTMEAWEAVVVDDGSSDGTRRLAEARAAADPRVRLVTAGGVGVSEARNLGLSAARGERVLFLDADDLLEPDALEVLGAALDEPGVDIAHGGWARFWTDGSREPDRFGPAGPDHFPACARGCSVAVHACLLDRRLVTEAGGFDASLAVCEDWDLWQRIARAGAVFRRVDRRVALYRVRADSASSRAAALARDGARVIRTGHAPDPRVTRPLAAHAAGRPTAELSAAWLTYAAWVGGVAIGRGEPADGLLGAVPAAPAPDLAPSDVAVWLGAALAVGADGRPGSVADALAFRGGEIDAFLAEIEERGSVTGLARRARRRLEARAAAADPPPGGVLLGGLWSCAWDPERSPPAVPPGADRVSLAIPGDGTPRIELPVVDGELASDVLAGALPDGAAWALLRAAMERWVLPLLVVGGRAGERTVAREGVTLGRGLGEDELAPAALLERLGWALFLQEAWGRPGWDEGRFYAGAPDRPLDIPDDAPVLALDVTDDLAVVALDGPVWVELGVAGAGLAVLAVDPPRGVSAAEALIPALTTATGFELCRAVVREALVGRPVDLPPHGIRERLRARRDERADVVAGPAPDDGLRAAPGWAAAAGGAAAPDVPTLVLGRRAGPPGSPSWRRARLPVAAASDLRALARVSGEPVASIGAGSPERVVYAPDAQVVRAGRVADRTRPTPSEPRPSGSPFGGSTSSLRADFEALFAAGADPWSYQTPYEVRKYEQTMALIGAEPVGRALEIGCAEGHFTADLAARARELVAADISTIALGRARERVEQAGHTGVAYLQLDLHTDPLPGRFDLIVASEVLYYLPDADALAAAMARMSRALLPGGRLVCAHANLLVDDPGVTGFDWDAPFGGLAIGRALAATPGLGLEVELRTPLYRVQVGRRRRRPRIGRRPTPRIVEEQAVWPEPDVAEAIVEGGGTPRSGRWRAEASPAVVPILMYHRVAASGPASLARWRVDPSALDEQWATLRDLGFAGLGLDAWGEDVGARRGPAGRFVVVTFDDAYEDVAANALPLLRRHGLPATVFVPTDHAGGAATWDAHLGPPAPILDWDALGHLAAAGVAIGSHSASHRPMTALSHAEVVSEVARSRAAIEDRLGVPVTQFAYPYGDADGAVRHLVGAAGIDVAVTCDPLPSRVGDDPLALPRIEVEGGDRLEDVVRKIG